MKSILNYLYTAWAILWFLLPFLLFSPFYYLFLSRKKWHPLADKLNRLWTTVTLGACFIRIKREIKGNPPFNRPCIFCPNHTSYLDIPTIYGSIPSPFCFIGKASLEKIPVFGYMYKKLHITVNRHSRRSRYESMKQSEQAIKEGKSLVIFPEGTIPVSDPWKMLPFHDGAFRLAVEEQIPLIPVTIPYNWIILPMHGLPLQYHPVKVIYHEPLYPQGKTPKELKDETFRIIQEELNKHL